MKRTVIRAGLILIIIAVIGFYVYDLVANNSKPTDHLFRTISIVCLCLASLIRTFGQDRKPLQYYDREYAEFKDAFADQPLWRNKLLCAIRLYNEDNFNKALKYLFDLKDRCRKSEDVYAVYLFAALCFTDMQLYEQAERLYQQLIYARIVDSRIFSNLGHVQEKMGKHELALANYEHALEYDSKNPMAYNNIAQAHFANHELEKAIPYAQKALEINPKTHQASTLLAIIYSLQGNKAEAEKYAHIAISSGRDPQELKEAVAYYRSAQHITEEE